MNHEHIILTDFNITGDDHNCNIISSLTPISVKDWDWPHEITGREVETASLWWSQILRHRIANRSHRRGLDLPVRLWEWNGLAMLENHRLVLLGHAPRLQKTRHHKHSQTKHLAGVKPTLQKESGSESSEWIRCSTRIRIFEFETIYQTSITNSGQVGWVLGQVVWLSVDCTWKLLKNLLYNLRLSTDKMWKEGCLTPWKCGAPSQIHHRFENSQLGSIQENMFKLVYLYYILQLWNVSWITCFTVLCCLIPSFLCMTGLFLYLSMMDFLSWAATHSGAFVDAIWLMCVPRFQSNLILSKTCPTDPTSHHGSYYFQSNPMMPCVNSYSLDRWRSAPLLKFVYFCLFLVKL